MKKWLDCHLFEIEKGCLNPSADTDLPLLGKRVWADLLRACYQSWQYIEEQWIWHLQLFQEINFIVVCSNQIPKESDVLKASIKLSLVLQHVIVNFLKWAYVTRRLTNAGFLVLQGEDFFLKNQKGLGVILVGQKSKAVAPPADFLRSF